MSIDRREVLLRGLFGRSRNRIRTVQGTRRRALGMLIAGDLFGRNVGKFLGNAPKLIREADPSQLEIFDNYKYVYFNGRLYMDCFAPGWPGRAFDRIADRVTDNLGRDLEDWDPFTLALVISITRKCVYRCKHCYAINTLGTNDVVSLEQLLEAARGFQRLGVGIIAWEGGEPLLRFDDLLTLIGETRDESEAWIATTAYGLDDEKAWRLKEAGLAAAIISLDHYDPDEHNRFRGNRKAFDMAVDGIRIFRENGILPNLCICMTRETATEEVLFRYLELAKEVGAAFVQILDATPSGNYLGQDIILTEAQLQVVRRFHREVNSDPGYRDYPSISARALLESDGCYGCSAGFALCYVDSSGNFQPCDLLQISFGNVFEEGVEPVYQRMKERFPHPRRGRCPAQTLHKEIVGVYERAGSLPLACDDCGHILDKISARGLPRMLSPKG